MQHIYSMYASYFFRLTLFLGVFAQLLNLRND